MFNFMSKSSRLQVVRLAIYLDPHKVYLYGSADDHNRRAELVGDDSWKWESPKESFKQIESYHYDQAGSFPKYAKPEIGGHRHQGAVGVSLPTTLEKCFDLFIEAGTNMGYAPILDMNS